MRSFTCSGIGELRELKQTSKGSLETWSHDENRKSKDFVQDDRVEYYF